MTTVMGQQVSLVRQLWRLTLGARRRHQIARLLLPRQPDVVDGKWVRWSRVEMDRQTRKMVGGLGPQNLDALEISGEGWADFGFRSYRQVEFPQFDICGQTLEQRFDLIIAEQVVEHLLWPYRAGRNVCAMLKPGGHFLVSTPFLVKVHDWPVDCSRWTELGLKHFLAECGFELDSCRTGSWGNRESVWAHFQAEQPVTYRPGKHTLSNEREFPHHVWALARKPAA